MIISPDFKGEKIAFLTAEARITQLEEITRNQQTQIDRLQENLTLLQEHTDWNDDPAIRRAQRSALTQTIGSLGWWGGALGTSETLKLGAALYLTGNEATAFGLAAWMFGCSVAAGPVEKIAKAVAVRITKGRYQTKPITI